MNDDLGGVTCAPVEEGASSVPGIASVATIGTCIDVAPTVGSSSVALAIGSAERSYVDE